MVKFFLMGGIIMDLAQLNNRELDKLLVVIYVVKEVVQVETEERVKPRNMDLCQVLGHIFLHIHSLLYNI